MIRAVIDTNVLVSGLLAPSGNEALILLAVRQGLVRPCLSEEIIAEYAEVLARPKFAFPPAEIAELIDMLHRRGEIFTPQHTATASPDRADTKFLECAEASAADVLVTGNKRHFPLGQYGKTAVLSGAELLEKVILQI